jgi:hypothetical protein
MNKREIDIKSANKIIAIVDNYFMVSSVVKSRRLRVMLPKQISQYFIRRNLKMPYQVIANIYSLKCHASVLHNFKKIDFDIINDPYVSNYVNDISNILRKDRGLQRYTKHDNLKTHEIVAINNLMDKLNTFQLRKIKKLLLVQTNNI